MKKGVGTIWSAHGKDCLSGLSDIFNHGRHGTHGIVFNAEAQRRRGAEEDEENSVSQSLCDKINTEAQRHRESHFFDRINRIDKIRK